MSACSVSAPLGLPLLRAHTAQALHCSAGNCLRPGLGCMYLPGLSHSGLVLRQLSEASEASPRLHAPPRSKLLRLGTQVALRGADSVGPAFCALPRTEQLRCLASAVAATYRLFLLLSFLGVLLAPLVRRMVTVQNPKKS